LEKLLYLILIIIHIYEYFNLYNINEARSGQIRWGDAIYTSKGIREKMIGRFGLGAGSG